MGNNTEAVLIDVGISCREVEKRMLRLNLSMKKVKAIFISHEHTDHITGIQSISAKYNLPIYVTEDTHKIGRLTINPNLIHYFSTNQKIRIGSLTVKAFSKLHDACDPHSFIVSDDNDVCIGIFTDIGKACEQVIYHFKQCNAVFLEANYDEAMLAAGSYPYFLKRRISGGKGHLSNTEALELFCTHRSEKLSHLILSHLSKNNNDPQLVEQIFRRYADKIKIVVASRYQETEVFQITQSTTKTTEVFYVKESVQLSMF